MDLKAQGEGVNLLDVSRKKERQLREAFGLESLEQHRVYTYSKKNTAKYSWVWYVKVYKITCFKNSSMSLILLFVLLVD